MTDVVIQSAMESPPIDQDIRCDQCDYNLRGLSVTGLCPECGSSIAHSLESARSPISLQLIRRGQHLAGLLVLECIAAMTAGAFAFGRPGESYGVAKVCIGIAWVVALVVFAIIARIREDDRVPLISRSAFTRVGGLIVSACALIAMICLTRMTLPRGTAMALGIVGVMPALLTLIPALILTDVCRRCRFRGLAIAHIVVAAASIVVAVWFAREILDEAVRMPDARLLIAMPVSGIDYAGILAPAIPLMWRGFGSSLHSLAISMVILRPAWLLLMVSTMFRLAREYRRRCEDRSQSVG